MNDDIKPGQVWAWNADIDADESQFRITAVEGDRARYEYVSENDPHLEGGFFHTVDTLTEKAHLVSEHSTTPAPLDPATCAHGTTAEDLCNAMPAKVELDAMWAAWKSLTPAEQRGWLEGGEGRVPTPAKIQLATALMPLHDAPDIENVPAASSMRTLMECVTEIYHGVRQIREALLPETAPSLIDQDGDGREAAPLDPGKVKAGDTVTLEASEGRRVTAPVSERTLPGHSKGTWFLDVYFDDDKPQAFSAVHWTLTDHQPAPEPKPEWEPEAIVRATVNGVPDTLLMRLTPGYEGGFVWATPTLTPRRPENEQSWLLYEDADITDVRPLVVIDPAAVDVDHLVDVGSNTDDSRTNTLAILAGLGIEAP